MYRFFSFSKFNNIFNTKKISSKKYMSDNINYGFIVIIILGMVVLYYIFNKENFITDKKYTIPSIQDSDPLINMCRNKFPCPPLTCPPLTCPPLTCPPLTCPHPHPLFVNKNKEINYNQIKEIKYNQIKYKNNPESEDNRFIIRSTHFDNKTFLVVKDAGRFNYKLRTQQPFLQMMDVNTKTKQLDLDINNRKKVHGNLFSNNTNKLQLNTEEFIDMLNYPNNIIRCPDDYPKFQIYQDENSNYYGFCSK